VAEGIDQTELCADEVGCSGNVYAWDLCKGHYMRQRAQKTLPPQFKRYPKGKHTLGEQDFAGRRWCSECQTFVTTHGQSGCSVVAISMQRIRASGWTQIEYDLALIEQGNRCHLCGKNPDGKALHADHDHALSVKRQLLCGTCNRGLGYFKDNPALLRKAANYVEAAHG
jgi:hypothetical protein